MRNTLEDLYYGNITPGAQQIAPDSELKRAVDRVARFEGQLTELLDETGQENTHSSMAESAYSSMAVRFFMLVPPSFIQRASPLWDFSPWGGRWRVSRMAA